MMCVLQKRATKSPLKIFKITLTVAVTFYFGDVCMAQYPVGKLHAEMEALMVVPAPGLDASVMTPPNESIR